MLAEALERHRAAIRALRDLSFNLEPVVLRDQGFTPAVQALADQLGLRHEIQIELDVAAAEELGEKVQAALYQIVREALNSAVRRGPPTRISVTRRARTDGRFVATIVDDGAAGAAARVLRRARGARANARRPRLTVEQRRRARRIVRRAARVARRASRIRRAR